MATSLLFFIFTVIYILCCAVLSSLTHFTRVRLFATPWTITRQAPLSMGIPQARIREWVVIYIIWKETKEQRRQVKRKRIFHLEKSIEVDTSRRCQKKYHQKLLDYLSSSFWGGQMRVERVVIRTLIFFITSFLKYYWLLIRWKSIFSFLCFGFKQQILL